MITKIKNNIRQAAVLMGTMLTFASCVDTVIIPDDKTVDEDFWQTKSDVSQMVNSAYYSMLDHDLMFRLLTWSEFRSDDVVRSPGLSSNSTTEALDQIQAQHNQRQNHRREYQQIGIE